MGGGFLSSEQGLGKPSQGLGLCFVKRMLQLANDKVASDWKVGGRIHMNASLPGSE